MDPRERDELRQLQQRVYGPDAVAGDADAARRLARLASGPVTGDAVVGDAAAGVPARTGRHAVVEPDGATERNPTEHTTEPRTTEHSTTGQESAGLEPRPPRPRGGRPSLGIRLVWAVSLAAVAIIASAITSTTVQPRALGAFPAGSEPVAFLSPDPGFRVPGFFIGGSDGETLAFEEFNGLRPIITTGGAYLGAGNEDQTCLTVVVNADLDSATSSSYSGVLFEGCGANAFAASTQFVVTEDLPSPLRDAFPAGTALQFVYDEESGEVLVSRSDP